MSLRNDSFVVIDVETTGTNPKEDRIIEIALLNVNLQKVNSYLVHRINPERPVGATHIHGITDEDIVGKPTFKEVAFDVIQWIGGKTLVAHNARFDLAFLRHELLRAGWVMPWIQSICTLELSHYYLPNLNRRTLQHCAEAIGVKIENYHGALPDAHAAAYLMQHYMSSKKKPKPLGEHESLLFNYNGSEFVYDEDAFSKSLARSEHMATRRKVTQGTQVSNGEKMTATFMQSLDTFKFTQVSPWKNEGFVTAYMEKLIEVLSDGQITESESQSLSDLQSIYELESDQIKMMHEFLLRQLALYFMDDESVSKAEKSELIRVGQALGLDESEIENNLKVAREEKHTALSKNASQLPEDWNLGEPLRIGDVVVFTGCDPEQRSNLEKKCGLMGVKVTSSVSRKTKFLVTDGSFSGNKARDAASLGTRIVTPEDFEILLAHIQPK